MPTFYGGLKSAPIDKFSKPRKNHFQKITQISTDFMLKNS